MPRRPTYSIASAWIAFSVTATLLCCFARPTSADELTERFTREVQPLLNKYCDQCHSGDAAEAKFLTTQFDNPRSIAKQWQSWDEAVRRLHEQEMPPPDEPQPTENERDLLMSWSRDFLQSEAERRRGEPGLVDARRLNAAEWNNVINDLVGHEINAAIDFPIDPANAEGFDNSGESLTYTSGVFQKFSKSIDFVVSHLLLTPDGIRFAPFPVVTDTDRDRYCVQRIVDFYKRQPTDLVPYLIAARTWKLSQETANKLTIEESAKQAAISPKYLQLLLDALQDNTLEYGPLREVQMRWSATLEPSLSEADVLEQCENIRRYIVGQRERLIPTVENLRAPGGINGGSQPLVLWKNREIAQNRRRCRTDGFNADPEKSVLPLELREKFDSLEKPQQVKILNDYEKFCSIFPDLFYVYERGRAHIDPKEAAKEAKGRLLSAGFHSMMGYFRDDRPLYELILSEAEQKELDLLWDELDFIGQVAVRQYAGHLWFERAEASFLNDDRFDFVRAEDKAANSSEMMRKFEAVYIDKLREKNASPQVIQAVEDYFDEMDHRLRKLERDTKEAEPKQLEAIIKLSDQIERYPTDEEMLATYRDYYKVTMEHLPNHRQSLEDTLGFMLSVPRSQMRIDLLTLCPDMQPYSRTSLPVRWSFFLWVGGPDRLLSEAAKNDELFADDKIPQHFQRLINDPKFERMAKEFLGNWLEFRRFENHNAVDRGQFQEFDDELRQAMFNEPIQYFVDLVRRNGRLIELIDSDHVVVNERLAEYYQLQHQFDRQAGGWQRITGSREVQRGGLISMGVFLTQNSPGLRTSPVKRGYWLVRKILGEKIPAPPPNVPELPDSEHDLGALTLRQALEKHRENPSCASCHARFDSFGLLLEGFDPIGKPRKVDLAGHTISSVATLPDGSEADGIVGLQNYISQQRADDFRRNFCQKLVAYSLGRSLILPDRLLVDDMLKALRENDDRIQAAFLVLLRSPQFQWKMGQDPELEDNNVAK